MSERHVFTRVRLENELRLAERLASLRVGDRVTDQHGTIWQIERITRLASENTAFFAAVGRVRELDWPLAVWETEGGAIQ